MSPPVALGNVVLAVNCFVCETVDMLNQFARICDGKLRSLSTAIRRTEVSIALLEAKLQSIDHTSNESVETVIPLENHVQDSVKLEIPEK